MLLGIDIGTSACKVTVFDIAGKEISSESCAYDVYYPHQGWAEQNPVQWWDSVCLCIRKTLSNGKIKAESITGIGIDGQSWSAIPIDKDGKVLANTPIWMDTRSSSVCEQIKERIGEDKLFEVSGNPNSPTYSASKILWFKNNNPELFSKTKYFLQSNSFIAFKLTQQAYTDVSQGYGFQFFDIKKLEYNLEIAKAMGIETEKIPPLCNCDEVIGTVTPKAAEETGLKSGTPVVCGGLDAACASLGAGVYKTGQTQEQGGTAGGMSICTSQPLAHKSLILGAHVVPGCWLLQGGTVGGGGAISWYRKEFGHGRSFKELDELAETVNAGSDGLIFLPYMAGERSPLWDENAKGVFFGLGFDKTEAHVIRSVMEGVAYSLEHNIRTALETGITIRELNSMGGAANSAIWTQIKADVTGRTINAMNSDSASSLGAAILAGIGTKQYKNYEEAVNATVSIRKTYLPNRKNHEIYLQRMEKYLKLYPALKNL